MKRYLIYSLTLVALMVSCVEEPKIYLRLPDEDAAAIPYHTGQMLDFVNQDGDTLTYVVTYDETKPFSEDYWDYADDSKTQIIMQPYCYARTVQLRCFTDSTSSRMMFTVLPDKIFYFNWNYQINIPYYDLNGTTETVEVNGETYENVHVSSYSGDFWHVWYYSEEVGLIAVKTEGRSLTLVR